MLERRLFIMIERHIERAHAEQQLVIAGTILIYIYT